jgi:2-C-methyl-D-erythritol 4-phosphate cytidylyltransferase
VVAAARLTDTVKEVGGEGEVERTLDRSRLWAAQTPQAFRAAALRGALADPAARAEATDDAMLVERAGGRVLLHEAPRENLKVTTPLDLRMAELLLAERR